MISRKLLIRLILAFELVPLILILSSCFLSAQNIDTLRYFKPDGYKISNYEIRVDPAEFVGYRSKLIKVVSVTYVSTSSTVILNAGEFESSFDMHDLWYKWVKKEGGTWNALNSGLWWFSGNFSTYKTLGWYSGDSIFILNSDQNVNLIGIKTEIQNFMQVFGGSRQ